MHRGAGLHRPKPARTSGDCPQHGLHVRPRALEQVRCEHHRAAPIVAWRLFPRIRRMDIRRARRTYRRMIGLAAFTVFALGLRHGADPDHLAAIDNVTRNAYERTPLLSRFVGTLFAGGHSIMVLALSELVGLLGARFATHGALIETIGTWISIVVLLALAALNVQQLRSGDTDRIAGAKTRLLPR